MSTGNFFKEVLDDVKGVEERILGPDYQYWKQIKSPSQMGMSTNGSISTIAKDVGGLINYVGGSYRHNIGSYNNGSSNFFNGIMSHVHFADGAMLAPTVFGETDATTGAWKIKVDPTFTPGTNGFSILMNGNTITDQSANSNNFSLTAGTLTDTKDCPDNVFATMNVLDKNTKSSPIA